MAELDPTLHELAEAFSIATEYWDWQGKHVTVPRHTIVAVLAALGVDGSTPKAAVAALEEQRRRPWTQMLPSFLALREQRTASVWVHVPHGDPVEVWLELETGESREDLRQLENWTPPREIDGQWVGEASFEIPADLPLGYHTLQARSGDQVGSMPLIITPAWLGFPARMGARRSWGLGGAALQRPLAAVLGHRRPDRPGGPCGLVGHRAPRRFRAGQPVARRRAAAADGALALPADQPALRQPDLSAGGTHSRVRDGHGPAAGQDRQAPGRPEGRGWPGRPRSTGTGPGRRSARR